jgi:hypothetical protein
MRSPSAERLRRGREIAAHEAPERVRPDRRGDGVPACADRHQIADVDGIPGGRPGGPRRGPRRPRGLGGAQRLRGPGAEHGIAGEHGARGVEHGDGPHVDRERPNPRQRALRRQRRGAHGRTRAATVGRARDNARVTFTRIAWLVTVLACVVTGVALLVSGYQGYAAVFGAVGACAAINLR